MFFAFTKNGENLFFSGATSTFASKRRRRCGTFSWPRSACVWWRVWWPLFWSLPLPSRSSVGPRPLCATMNGAWATQRHSFGLLEYCVSKVCRSFVFVTLTVRDIFLAPFRVRLVACVVAVVLIAAIAIVIISRASSTVCDNERGMGYTEALIWCTGTLFSRFCCIIFRYRDGTDCSLRVHSSRRGLLGPVLARFPEFVRKSH